VRVAMKDQEDQQDLPLASIARLGNRVHLNIMSNAEP